MPRILAIDYGKKRTGLAETDDLQIIASPMKTVETNDLFSEIAYYLASHEVECIVVGLPTCLNGDASSTTQMVQLFIGKLERKYPALRIEKVDERFTSKIAKYHLVNSGMKKSKRREKGSLDKISAAIILQSYLDSK